MFSKIWKKYTCTQHSVIPDKKLELLHMRVSSAIDLAADFASPVSWRILACTQANVLISSEASERPTLLTGLSCDINGICIFLRMREYVTMVVLFTSVCKWDLNS